jgi:hypothetical protein
LCSQGNPAIEISDEQPESDVSDSGYFSKDNFWNGLANASSARKFRGRKSAVIFADVDRPVLVPVEGRAQRDSNL